MPQATPWSRCTVQKNSGNFCDDPSVEDAPFPICLRHAAQLYGFIRGHIQAVADDRETVLDAAVELLGEREVTPCRSDPSEHGIVYYVQIGDMVKIGTSVNLKQRLQTYPPNRRLLATEPGGYLLESERHAQFVKFRISGEWFEPAPELLAHIAKLNRSRARPPRAA